MGTPKPPWPVQICTLRTPPPICSNLFTLAVGLRLKNLLVIQKEFNGSQLIYSFDENYQNKYLLWIQNNLCQQRTWATLNHNQSCAIRRLCTSISRDLEVEPKSIFYLLLEATQIKKCIFLHWYIFNSCWNLRNLGTFFCDCEQAQSQIIYWLWGVFWSGKDVK